MDVSEARLKELMVRGLDGDGRAHSELLTLLSLRLRAYFIQRMSGSAADVEDLVQETLLAIHTRRITYDRTQLLTPWAHAIARYKLIDHWRRRKLRVTTPLDDVADFLAGEAVQTDDGLDLTRALQGLPDRQRALIEAVKIEGLSLAEAGQRTGATEGATKVALHRALKTLAERMRRADR